MEFIVITGQSGAGKSQAKKVFEDLGYYCVDNIPPALIPNFVDLLDNNSEKIEKAAIVVDIRGEQFFKALEENLVKIQDENVACKVFYFEASDKVLLNRFKETRRSHPLNPEGQIEENIQNEKRMLARLKQDSDYVIDTSKLNHSQLKERILQHLDNTNLSKDMVINVVSFGFKKGLPLDLDYMFDVRILPNPYYIESLRPMTGNDVEVRNYVMNFEESRIYFDKVWDFVQFILPLIEKEGRSQLVIGFGCTGGQHRSVTFANLLGKKLSQSGKNVNVIHRHAKH